VLAATGKTHDAEQAYQRAVNLLNRLVEEVPESALRRADLAKALDGLADLFKDSGRRQEAVEIRRQVIRHYEMLGKSVPEYREHERNQVLSYLALVSLLWDLGRQAEAAEPYRKAIAMGLEAPAVNNELALFLANNPELRLRDAALAERLARKAVIGQPQSADYRNTLGVANYRKGDDKAAIGDLEKAMSLRDGGNSYDWFFLAMAYSRLGERDKAQTWFDRAVQWMDSHRPHDEALRGFRAEAEAMMAKAGNH